MRTLNLTALFTSLLSLFVALLTPTFAFAQVCSGPASTTSGTISVPFTNLTPVPTTLTVPDTGLIGDVNIEVNINHTFVADIILELVSPLGTAVQLKSSDASNNGDNMYGTVFDDEAITPIASYQVTDAPFTGSWQPDGNLSDMDGESAAGLWTLNLSDAVFLGDPGELTSWTLEFVLYDQDVDGDGFTLCAGPDCDDGDANSFPGAVEVCTDGVDQSCSGTPDDDPGCADGDLDGHPGYGLDGISGNVDDDCDDGDPFTYFGAPEICGDGNDQSCSGVADDGPGCVDNDGDGVALFGGDGIFGTPDDDCDDGDATVFPLAPEQCDGVDDDCDGSVDEDFDVDNDGYFDANGLGCVSTYGVGADCDDTVFGINPGAVEQCDAIDNNCSGSVDDDPAFNVDGDPVTTCGPDGILGNGDDDCNDNVATIYPGAPEGCDGLDSDCDGSTPLIEIDDDADGFFECQGDCDDTSFDAAFRFPGNPEVCDGLDNDCDLQLPSSGLQSELDEDLDGQMVCEGDCNDDPSNSAAASTFLGATETPNDGVDQNCNGADTVTCSVDDDEDSFGDLFGAQILSEVTGDCTPTGMVSLVDATDCNDSDNTVFPGATESCDSIDSNCDLDLVDGFDDFDSDGEPDCVDADDDEDGDPDTSDCNDLDATVYTGQDETLPIYVDDGIDQDCNGFDTVSCYRDTDRDGYGGTVQLLATDGQCDNSQQESDETGDCDDGDAAVNPGESEVCDGVDNDCSGSLGEEEEDGDGDGWTICDSDGQPQGGDCDDDNEDVHPEAAEACDGLDTDCDGTLPLDEVDADSDGAPACSDCDDDDPDRSPNFTEQCDGVDNDCDGTVEDEELDGDGDGWTPCNGDCDDGDAAVTPDASEECDGKDTDCDGELLPEGEDDVDADSARECDGDCDDTDAQRYPGNTETCDGVDHDCSGSSQDDLDCTPATPEASGFYIPADGSPDCSYSGTSSSPTFLVVLLFSLLAPLRRRRQAV